MNTWHRGWPSCQWTPSPSTARTSGVPRPGPHVPLIQTQNLVRQVPFLVELRNVPFRQQEQIAFYLLIDRLPNFMGGAFDARGNGQFLAEVAMQRYGATRIQQVMLSESWYREAHAARQGRAGRRHPGRPGEGRADVLADLRTVQVIKGVPRIPETRTTGEDKGKRHGDAAVAVALAYFASREINSWPGHGEIAPSPPPPESPRGTHENQKACGSAPPSSSSSGS